MHLPVALSAVSQAVQSIVAQEFGRTSTIIPNSVDCDKFRPGPLSCHPYSAVLTAPANEVYHSQIVVHRCSRSKAQIAESYWQGGVCGRWFSAADIFQRVTYLSTGPALHADNAIIRLGGIC